MFKTTISAYLLLVVATFLATFDTGILLVQAQNCVDIVDCVECLESSCTWFDSFCADHCALEDDEDECLVIEDWPNNTAEEVCQYDAQDIANAGACSIKRNCGDCTRTVLPFQPDDAGDETVTCMWHYIPGVLAICKSGCNSLGCGVYDCDGSGGGGGCRKDGDGLLAKIKKTILYHV